MGKHILLIGVDANYPAVGASPAIANVTSLQQTLLTEVDGLRDDHVTVLLNPDLRQLQHAIARMTYHCRRGDLCLIYYTGRSVIAPNGTFYLTAQDTDNANLTTTALSSDYIRQALPSTKENLQRVMILDCLWLSAETTVVDHPLTYSEATLLETSPMADCNCAVLTAQGSAAAPWPIGDSGLSFYTQWLIEGITSGLADMDADGGISVNDIQTYMEQCLEDTHGSLWPLMMGDCYDLHQSLMEVRGYSPEREYRRGLEEYARRHRGHLPVECRNVLEFLRHQLGLSVAQSQAIEADVMAPYAGHQSNCDRYRQALLTALSLEEPLGQPLKKWLRHLQGELSLSYEDVATIERCLLNQESYPQLAPLLTGEFPRLPEHVSSHHTNGQPA
ncbi:MAG: hypothetical protein AAF821_03955 [Cyanobacteria bacterium P01_D01_bin.156]